MSPMNPIETRLRVIYRNALARTNPSRITREILRGEEIRNRIREPVSAICLGKCASAMFKGLTATTQVAEAFAAYPAGYLDEPFPVFVETAVGTHPEMRESSFEAGEKLIRFAERSRDRQVIVLVSGGTSATVAAPLEPSFTPDDLNHINQVLVRSGIPIEKINTVRKHLSAIKGGRLGERLPEGSITFVLSDVSRGSWHDVGSGPTLPDVTTNSEAAEILQGLDDTGAKRLAEILLSGDVPETPKRLDAQASFLVGDNETLVNGAKEEASRLGFEVTGLGQEFNGDVGEVADELAELVESLAPGEWIVAGGEPTVRVTGEGRGGRCSELAVRLGQTLHERAIDDSWGLLATSDGVDGLTGAAGFILTPERYSRVGTSPQQIAEVLGRSDSLSIVEEFAIRIDSEPSGNNLRDLFIVGRATDIN